MPSDAVGESSPDPLILFSQCGKALHPFYGMRGFALFSAILQETAQNHTSFVKEPDAEFTVFSCDKGGTVLSCIWKRSCLW